jgi:hypothetical protein
LGNRHLCDAGRISLPVPVLQKLGIWRVPGDIRFKLFGQIFCLPFGSTLIVSILAFAAAKLLQ